MPNQSTTQNRYSIMRLLAAGALLFALMPSAGRAGEAVTLDRTMARQELGAAVEYLQDASGKLTVADVAATDQAVAFRPVAEARSGNEINFGYSQSVYWLRWEVEVREPLAVLLEVGFPSLDHVALYQEHGGRWQAMTEGDLEPFAARVVKHRNFVFPLSFDRAGRHTLYLRVASQGSLTLPLTLWRADAFDAANQASYSLLALYFGILLALAMYNLILYFSLRDRNYLLYVCFVAGNAIGQASLFGLGNQYLWPMWPAWGNAALPTGYAVAGLFGLFFVRHFLETKTWAPRHDRVLALLTLWFAVILVSPALMPYRWVAFQVSLAGVASSVMVVWSAVVCLRRGYKGAGIFLLAWTLLMVGVGILGLRNMNWLPTNFFTLHAMMIGSALEMILLSFALADRFHVLRQEKEIAQSQALIAQTATLEALQRSEQMLEHQVAERTLALSESNAQLRESEARFRAMADSAPLMIWVDGPDRRISWANKGWLGFTGYTIEQKVGASRLDMVHPEDKERSEETYARHFDARESFNMEYRLKQHDGNYRWILDSGGPRFDAQGKFVGYIGSCIDISDRKFSEEIIWTQANYDVLTGLPNRRLFLDRLHQEVKKTQRADLSLALLFVDLDHFKEVNDTLGHQAGDAVLVETASRIGSCVRDTDTVARLGGDEFTVILPELADIARVEQVAQELVRTLSEPFVIKDQSATISASVGIAIFPDDADEMDRLIRVADKAMYAAKSKGRNRYCRAGGA